jgi:hypothetical protein
MLNIQLVEQVHYQFDRQSMKLERSHGKVYKIAVKNDEFANNAKEALTNMARDFAEVINNMRD